MMRNGSWRERPVRFCRVRCERAVHECKRKAKALKRHELHLELQEQWTQLSLEVGRLIRENHNWFHFRRDLNHELGEIEDEILQAGSLHDLEIIGWVMGTTVARWWSHLYKFINLIDNGGYK